MSDSKTNRVLGSLLGLAIGDAFGAPFEGGIVERALWTFIGKQNGKLRWTDDTQMTIDVIESLIKLGCVDQNDLARRFAQSYRWSRGYGPGAARVLKSIRRGRPWETAARAVYRDGSFGNGGAMRSAPIGLFYAAASVEKIITAADAAATVTHSHPLGREGAVMVALTTAFAFNDIDTDEIIERLAQRAKSNEFLKKLQKAKTWLRTKSQVEPQRVARELGGGIAAVESCVTAVYMALSFRDRSFDELLDFAIMLRGDADTIAAMACAIWGASRGLDELPQARLEQIEQSERLKTLARSFSEAMGSNPWCVETHPTNFAS